MNGRRTRTLDVYVTAAAGHLWSKKVKCVSSYDNLKMFALHCYAISTVFRPAAANFDEVYEMSLKLRSSVRLASRAYAAAVGFPPNV